ncbi:hypothetical protein CU669_10145 [Paramagnetospirillum kuznetsovii]|uniref:Uncharacterized protein n=1 Tax=Paramagnetospirillum kuznetsovii TaxID=2053833 RepID=A0A364NYA1_9PROT|nr:hypothetical protein [Paramagnetospirillum kuznetsovii]RAU22046.1 hypothetical protein CU669_10145 [Paramagnetospirillum kuznetsovii]
MADITLKVVADVFAQGREIMDTGVAMMGLEGDNAFCGNCGREMMHMVPIRTMAVKLLYRCSCGALNEVPTDS